MIVIFVRAVVFVLSSVRGGCIGKSNHPNGRLEVLDRIANGHVVAVLRLVEHTH